MRALDLKAILRTVVSGASVLLIGAGLAQAQQAEITAGAASAGLPDGNLVPMWGYRCDAVSGGVSCSAMNPSASGSWSPILITVPTGSDLNIKLSNQLPAGIP